MKEIPKRARQAVHDTRECCARDPFCHDSPRAAPLREPRALQPEPSAAHSMRQQQQTVGWGVPAVPATPAALGASEAPSSGGPRDVDDAALAAVAMLSMLGMSRLRACTSCRTLRAARELVACTWILAHDRREGVQACQPSAVNCPKMVSTLLGHPDRGKPQA